MSWVLIGADCNETCVFGRYGNYTRIVRTLDREEKVVCVCVCVYSKKKAPARKPANCSKQSFGVGKHPRWSLFQHLGTGKLNTLLMKSNQNSMIFIDFCLFPLVSAFFKIKFWLLIYNLIKSILIAIKKIIDIYFFIFLFFH